MKAAAILKVFFGGCLVLVSIRQLVVAMHRNFGSEGERGGYLFGTVACLGLAVWFVVSGIRTRR